MDPIAHTLVGASLAQTGLGKRVRFGTAALVIGANLPDVDSLVYFLGSDAGLYYRRGWTHGAVAMIVLPLLLAGLLFVLGRRNVPPPKVQTLVWLSYLGVVTHPLLDWLNTYGVRLLMPLDPRWYYGDAVFIVNPWIWLVLGAAVFVAHSTSRGARVYWTIGIGLTSLFILLSLSAQLWGAKILWIVGWATAISLRWKSPPSDLRSRRAAVASLATVAFYLAFMVGSTLYSRHGVSNELARRGLVSEQVMVGPVPANPFVRDVVVVTPVEYLYGTLSLFPDFELHLEREAIPKPFSTPIVERALESPEIRGFANWVRFPFVEIEETDSATLVHIMDARYTRRRGQGFGSVSVSIPK